jgi:hypothetical protein
MSSCGPIAASMVTHQLLFELGCGVQGAWGERTARLLFCELGSIMLLPALIATIGWRWSHLPHAGSQRCCIYGVLWLYRWRNWLAWFVAHTVKLACAVNTTLFRCRNCCACLSSANRHVSAQARLVEQAGRQWPSQTTMSIVQDLCLLASVLCG